MKESNIHIHKQINIKGEYCPYTMVKTKLGIEFIGVGEILEIRLDNPDAAKNIPDAAAKYGHQVISVEKIDDTDWLIQIRKTHED